MEKRERSVSLSISAGQNRGQLFFFGGGGVYKSSITKPKPTERKWLQELLNPPSECCDIVIWWEAFISEGVPTGCNTRKKARLIKLSPAHRRIGCMTMHLLRKTSASKGDTLVRYESFSRIPEEHFP